MKFGCSIGIFLNSANLICRSTDISKCFTGSLQLRDNESRLYLYIPDPPYRFLLFYCIKKQVPIAQDGFSGEISTNDKLQRLYYLDVSIKAIACKGHF